MNGEWISCGNKSLKSVPMLEHGDGRTTLNILKIIKLYI